MPTFILSCLVLTFLLLTDSFYLPYLLEAAVWQAALALAIACYLAGLAKKLSGAAWHDGFAACLLWAWYGCWKPLFSPDAPMFFAFPPFFAVLSGWLWFAVISKSRYFDQASRDSLIYVQTRLARFNTLLLAPALLASLWIPEHYLVYPVLMCAFIVRYTLQRCLEIVQSD
ncbi:MULTISPECIES: hypothetical protein [Methylomonas]|uniref:hypothetical protein n=1 Tax=Methylomonas TaxID=416 RepID=UPI001231E124|nr:hypothetical protein [Methylomonas rhizoryzae]